MNILFLFISYPEESNSTNLNKDLSDEFVKQGENVYVATIREKKMGLGSNISVVDNTNLLRVEVGNLFNDTSKIEKLISMMTMSNRLLKEIKKQWGNVKFDLIVGTTPYMANSKLLQGLKSHYSCPSFLILWDLFPQNAKDLGLIKNNILFKFFKRGEYQNLKSFDHIGCMSLGNMEYVEKNYNFIDKRQLSLFPLWSKILPKESIDKFEIRKKYNFRDDDFILVFGGNMGKPQSLENIINLANKVKEREKIKFLFVGKGSETPMLKNRVEALNLKNVIFKDFIVREDYEKLISACDIGMVSLDARFTVPNFPSKTVDYLKLGLPILASLDDCSLLDYGDLLENHMKAGLCSHAGDTSTLKDNLFRIMNDKALYSQLSKNGREYYEKSFNVEYNYEIIRSILSR